MITKRQKQILDFIKIFSKNKGYIPSMEEIKIHFRLSSVSTISHHISRLEKEGYIKKHKNQPRAIEIVENKDDTIEIPLIGTIINSRSIIVIDKPKKIQIPRLQLFRPGRYYALRILNNELANLGIFNKDIIIIRTQKMINDSTISLNSTNSKIIFKKFSGRKINIKLHNTHKTPWLISIKAAKKTIIRGVVVDVIKNTKKIQVTNFNSHTLNTRRYNRIPINQIICGDSAEELKKIPSNSIDLVVTSPPYDNIRKYHGFHYDLHATGQEIYRVLKNGGIAVMVIQDQTKHFGKSLTSFRTIVDWVDNIGFKLFECLIYKKHGAEGAWWRTRFRVDHEYMPVFLKGERPQYFNKEPLKIPSKWGGKTLVGGATRLTNGKTLKARPIKINLMKDRGTIWDYTTCGDGTRLKHTHPATFPDKLPYDFIQCFCPPNGIVLDPFIGSGTTALAAIQLGRRYIGIDISKDYCDLAKRRIKEEGNPNQSLF